MRKILLAVLLVIFCEGVSFSAPARIGALTCIGLSESDVLTWTEKIAVLEGKQAGFKNENIIVFYDNLTSMLMALNAGKIDRFALPSIVAKYIAARNSKLNYIDHHHNKVMGYSLAALEPKREILTAVNRAISDMKADGTLTKLQQKYILELGNNDPEPVIIPVIDGAESLKIAITGDLPPMDCILADGTPAGFNTAFLADLSKRINKNFELVNIDTGARESALMSGKVDLLFWICSIYNDKGEIMPYPLDKLTGAVISEPYLLDSRAALEIKK
ncbi:MAG: transporter substrate-binding domain-containing protein [Synergistaceae bacterium]|nr:transporter substrate-binding domain-containing protein [Synergistaceae bacterium]